MHSFPDFDYEALSSLAKRILSSRKTIRDDTQVKDWQLDDLLTYATREKLIVMEDLDRTFWRSENPEVRDTKLESEPRYQMADALERLVTAEIQRRQELTTAPAMPPAHREPREKGSLAISPKTFTEMFCSPSGKDLAISAAEKAELIKPSGNSKWQWDYEHTTGAIRAFFDALQDTPGLIHNIKVTPGCKLIAQEFGVKEVKNYPEADFTPRLRKEIKSYLPKQQG